MEDYIGVEILKKILGDHKYEQLINNISFEILGERNLDIEITDFFDEIVSRYCVVILNIGISKKVEIEELVIKLKNDILKVNIKDFVSKYDEYIKLVENKRFDEFNKLLN